MRLEYVQLGSSHFHQGLTWLNDQAATMGLALISGKGSGKSTLIGKEIAWSWWQQQGYGVVLIDPTGGSIDQALDRLARHLSQVSPEEAQQLLQRVRYVDFAGVHNHIVSWPLIHHYPGQGLYQATQPFLEIVRRVDPALSSAPIQGLASVEELFEYAGILIAAFSESLTIVDVEDLLRWSKNNNATWKKLAAEAVCRYPETASAVDYLENIYRKLSAQERMRLSGSLMRKLRPFSLDLTLRSIFGVPGQQPITMADVVDKGILLLADFRHVTDQSRRQFLLLMLLQHVINFVKWRGAGKHHKRLGLIVDELTTLTDQMGSSGEALFANDLQETINVIARNSNLMTVFALQEAWQVSEKLLASLHSCANVCQGVSSDHESALLAAKHLFPYKEQTKRTEPVYRGSPPELVERKKVPFSPAEWEAFISDAIRQIKPFKFLVRSGEREGDFTAPVQVMSLKHWVSRVQVDQKRVEWLREQLAIRDGRPIPDILKEIEERQNNPLPEIGQVGTGTDSQTAGESDRLLGQDATADNLSPHPSQAPNGDSDDITFGIPIKS